MALVVSLPVPRWALPVRIDPWENAYGQTPKRTDLIPTLLPAGRIPRVLGFAALTGVVLATAEYAGSGLRGVFKRDVDEYERKEFLRKNRRRPIEETLAEIGEGRGEWFCDD
jgi:hypothetical protein